jgi:hypothetical protein
MKTTSGNQKYSDFEPPWSPVAQEDWSAAGEGGFCLDVTAITIIGGLILYSERYF